MVGENDEAWLVVHLLHLDNLQVCHRHVVWEDLDFLDHDGFRGVDGVERVYIDGGDELDDLPPRRADVDDVVSLTGGSAEPKGDNGVIDIIMIKDGQNEEGRKSRLSPGIDGDDGHPFLHAGPNEERVSARVANGPVHERVPLDEVESCVVELPAVGRARAGPGRGRVGHREPVGVGAGLALEGALVEGVADVAEPEGADGTAGDGVVGRSEYAVDELVPVAEVHHLAGRRLDLPKLEGHVPGHGAVQARLQERRPLVLEFVGASRVVLAHARHAREHGLRDRE